MLETFHQPIEPLVATFQYTFTSRQRFHRERRSAFQFVGIEDEVKAMNAQESHDPFLCMLPFISLSSHIVLPPTFPPLFRSRMISHLLSQLQKILTHKSYQPSFWVITHFPLLLVSQLPFFIHYFFFSFVVKQISIPARPG